MRRRTNIYVMIMILLAVSIGIGYAYLQTSLTMIGNITVRKYDPPRYLYDEIVAQNKENGLMVLDNQSSTYVSASTGIDFNVAASDTNGKGVYVRNGTESDTYPIYYYRGEVTNNNVLFANFCWKIVRTTETGGIKLIYNGIPKDYFENTPIESSGYTSVTNDATYAYTYDSTTKNWTSTNKTNSTTGTITFSVATAGYYVINYVVSSEKNWDKAYFYLDGVELGVYSGTVNGSISLGEITSSNVITVKYTKDSSSASGSDTVSFNVGLKTGEIIKSCDNTGTDSQIGTSAFNSSSNYNAYVGYMYGTPNSSTHAAEHLSTKTSTSSKIKTAIDTWYGNNMTGYTSYLEDTVWCNDRSFASSNTGTGTGTSVTNYGADGRVANSTPQPSLECVNQNDRFTVNETMEGRANGNGALTYPVALLTADELTLAGNGWNGYSTTSYLHTGQSWWSMSPRNFTDSNVYMFSFRDAKGDLTISTANSLLGGRPVVSLRFEIEIGDVGDGRPTNPFVINCGEKTITIEGNDDIVSNLKKATAGTKVELLSKSKRNIINSFKMNGILIEGSSFTMPEVDAIITEINVTVINSLYDVLVNRNKENGTMVLDNQSSYYVTYRTGIDFNVAPSDTNGKGVYVRNGTESNTYPIYYYRGAVTDNNVIFANFCWKIVRTTETGGIKLIYNGRPTNGTCNNTGTASQIGKSAFNSSYNDNAYVGYKYGAAGQGSYNATHNSTKSSATSVTKTAIDTWYSSNMTSYTNYLEDTIWCSDRSLYTGNGIGKNATYYNAYLRTGFENVSTPKPSLTCVNQNDRFTVNATTEGRENGNGALNYPVALLTADEVTLAGHGWNGYSNSSYLYTSENYWVMSPCFYDGGAFEFYVNYNGVLTATLVNTSNGVRPSVSLKHGTEISENGDGSVNSPFVVQ